MRTLAAIPTMVVGVIAEVAETTTSEDHPMMSTSNSVGMASSVDEGKRADHPVDVSPRVLLGYRAVVDMQTVWEIQAVGGRPQTATSEDRGQMVKMLSSIIWIRNLPVALN